MKNLSRSVKKYANFHKRIQLILKTFHRNRYKCYNNIHYLFDFKIFEFVFNKKQSKFCLMHFPPFFSLIRGDKSDNLIL